MSWARYDDALPHNRKVAWLRAQGVNGVAALGLHLLLNTWSRHEGMQGFIPTYVPEQLAGRPWRKLVGLLADEGCAMLTAVANGWMINDYDEYGDRDDGTPVEEKKARLSRVRAEAGRRGGLAKAGKAPGNTPSKTESLPGVNDSESASNSTSYPQVSSRTRAGVVNGSERGNTANTGLPASKRDPLPPSNGWQSSSPVPVPEPLPTKAPTSGASPNADGRPITRILRAYADAAIAAGNPAPAEAQRDVENSARSLLEQGFQPHIIEAAARNAGAGGWRDLARQVQIDNRPPSRPANGAPARNGRVAENLAVVEQLRAHEAQQQKAITS